MACIEVMESMREQSLTHDIPGFVEDDRKVA